MHMLLCKCDACCVLLHMIHVVVHAWCVHRCLCGVCVAVHMMHFVVHALCIHCCMWCMLCCSALYCTCIVHALLHGWYMCCSTHYDCCAMVLCIVLHVMSQYTWWFKLCCGTSSVAWLLCMLCNAACIVLHVKQVVLWCMPCVACMIQVMLQYTCVVVHALCCMNCAWCIVVHVSCRACYVAFHACCVACVMQVAL